MAEALDPKEIVPFDERLTYEVIRAEALINLLDRKGIVTKRELFEEIKKVKATLPKSETVLTVGKRKGGITKEEALKIAGRNAGPLSFTGITDKYHPGWVIYNGNNLKNCWYVTFNPSLTCFTLGPSYMVAVSKKDGSILYSGSTGGD